MVCACIKKLRDRGRHVASLMEAIADGLAERDVATLRYQFPYMEKGSKRPDVPKLAQATVREAVGEALRLLPGLAVVAGGKSFGGRMTSQAQAASPLPGVQGLVFLRFPLHAAGQHRTNVETIYSRSKSRCCFYREPVMRSQRPNS